MTDEDNKRRKIFAWILAVAIAIDMASTYLMIKSGYREITGIVQMMLDASPIILILWIIFWWCLVYFTYPLSKRWRLTTHIETIAIYYAMMSFIAGVGNLYLYIRYA